jgi:formate--tetrahydrofolate ligase
VVAITRFETDSAEETALLRAHIENLGVPCAVTTSWADGGKGALELARKTLASLAGRKLPAHPYDYAQPLRAKVKEIATKIYGAETVDFDMTAKKKIRQFEENGYANLPVCIAKTQYSFSDDPMKLGAPKGFDLAVRDARLNSGAGFIVILCGDIMRMPGLPKAPAAVNINIDDDGNIEGLF